MRLKLKAQKIILKGFNISNNGRRSWMHNIEILRSELNRQPLNTTVTKEYALQFLNTLLDEVPYAKGINNPFFLDFLNPDKPPPSKASLHIMLQNWLEQKRILRRSLVQGLEASVVSEYWQGQMAYLDLLKDEIEGHHVNLAWESLRQPAKVAGIDLPHSVDSQDAPEIVPEMRALRSWQAEDLRDNFLILVAVAIFERQAQPVLRRTYQALDAWYGEFLDEKQRKNFERYFAVHTCISDIETNRSFADVTTNIPPNDGVEEKHVQVTADCFIHAKKNITVYDLKQAIDVFEKVNNKQSTAWISVYNKCISHDLLRA